MFSTQTQCHYWLIEPLISEHCFLFGSCILRREHSVVLYICQYLHEEIHRDPRSNRPFNQSSSVASLYSVLHK